MNVWHNPNSGWQRLHTDRIEREERMLEARRRKERDERECSPPNGPIAPSFMADGLVVAPCAMRQDQDSQFVVVSVDGRLCCLGEERSNDEKTAARTVLMLVESKEHEDAPACPLALQWCEFEYRVRIREPLALAVYGLMRAALVVRAADDERRVQASVNAADAVFGALVGAGAGE